MVRTGVPQPLTAQYDSLLFVSDSTFVVTCPVNNARVTVTVADSILATTVVVNGEAVLEFPPLSVALDTIQLVITAYNMVPFLAEIIVRDIPAPVVAGFTGLPTRVVPGHSVSFADTTTGNTTTWNWSFPGGTPDVSTEKNPVITYETVGTYDVKLIVSDGFSTDSIFSVGYIVADFPTALEDKAESFTCTVLPNPSNGMVTLQIKSSVTGPLELTVFDLIGTRVYSEQSNSMTGQFSKSLNLTTLPDGIYFLKVSGKEVTATKKLVIRK
jgi:PKD repeat protein